MISFTYYDQRQRRLAAAHAAIGPQFQPLVDELAALQADPHADPAVIAAVSQKLIALEALESRLQREPHGFLDPDWRLTDRTYHLVASDWLWQVSASEILQEVQTDPVILALNESPLTTPELAGNIENLLRETGDATPDWFDRVLEAVNGQEPVMSELVYAAHRLWFAAPPDALPSVYDDVGVLLPLRLETLFEAPAECRTPAEGRTPAECRTQWNLLLRVIPDEASICRDIPKVSRGEHDSLLAFWRAADISMFLEVWLDSPEGKAAWSALCARVGAARAAWLVSAFEPQFNGDNVGVNIPAEHLYPPGTPVQEQYVPNRIGGMPPELAVWVMTNDPNNGPQRHNVGFLQINNAREDLVLPLPDNINSVRQSWWASWTKAQEVGMGGVFALPEGVTPENITALYVVGIGDESPNAHFQAQVDAGTFGMLRLGSPTNSVQSEPTADLTTETDDWHKVAVRRMHELNDPGARQSAARSNVSLALMGDPVGLSFYLGADSPADTETSREMMQALYPALWGHWLRDIWQGDDDAQRAGLWAMQHLFPEGPLMPIRIGEQPYGLLPTTALSQWRVRNTPHGDPRQQDVEQRMAEQLAQLRDFFAAQARAQGNIVGKDTRGLIDLLSRDASSRTFLARQFMPAQISAMTYGLFGASQNEFLELVREYYRSVEQQMGQPPADYYVEIGYAVPNTLPLVKPRRMIYSATPRREDPQRVPLLELLQALLGDMTLENFYRRFDRQDRLHYILPDSLFVRLLIYACQVGMQWNNSNPSQVTRDLLQLHQKMAQLLAESLDREEWSVQDRQPHTGAPIFRLDKMPDDFRIPMERAFRSTLDTASHRIDPWVTGFAWQRLVLHSNSYRRVHRLGVYGWVDGPFIGQPGPTDAGRLHAPSYGQALASLVLRDQFLSSHRRAAPGARNPWQMDIDSCKVRVAEEIADEVRLGFNIHEIVGRRVENILSKHQVVKDLRTNEKYAMHPERRHPNEVCDGIRALKGLLKGNPEAVLTDQDLSLAADMLDQPAGDPLFPLLRDQRSELKLLHLALDTYADLLMADGVMQVVNRQIDRAAETMDAASGFSRPPTFEFIRTPPSGYQLETRVLTVLPFIDVETIAATDSPCRIAEPAIAACIEQKLGRQWQWTVVNAEHPDKILGTVTLDALGFKPPDALVLSSEFLSEAARLKLGFPLIYISEGRNRLWEAIDAAEHVVAFATLLELGLAPDTLAELSLLELDERLRAKLGVAPEVTIRDGVLQEPRIWIARDEHAQLLGMVTVADLGMTSAEVDVVAEATIHAKVRAHLGLIPIRVNPPQEHRLARAIAAGLGNRPAAGRDLAKDAAAYKSGDAQVRADLLKRYKKLHDACQDTIQALTEAADDATRTAALQRAVRWGITVIADPHDRDGLFAALLGTPLPPASSPLSDLAKRAARSLAARLKRAPAPDNAPAALDVLARELAALASPDGQLSILSKWERTRLLDGTGLKIDQVQATLDESWLTVVAPVRPPLARFEGLQLEARVRGAFAPFAAWTSSPDDPWRTAVVPPAAVQVNINKRATSSPLEFDLTPFVAAYGSPDAWVGGTVAVGLLDAFGEAIPMKERTTMTAFGFNAPAARAPQAILLAVPPIPRQRLENDLVLQIVVETRELAHARAVRSENRGELQMLAPSMWLQTSGIAKVHLEPWALWT